MSNTSNQRQHYLQEDDNQLRELVARGLAPWEIAEIMDRTEVALYYRRKKLNLDPGAWPGSRKYQRLKKQAT